MLVDGWGFVDGVSGNPFISRWGIRAMNGLSKLFLLHLHGILVVRGGYDWNFLRSSSKIQNLFQFYWSFMEDHLALCHIFQESGMICTWLS